MQEEAQFLELLQFNQPRAPYKIEIALHLVLESDFVYNFWPCIEDEEEECEGSQCSWIINEGANPGQFTSVK